MITLNLLPDLVLQRRKDAQTKKLAVMAVIAWAAILILVILGSYGLELVEKGILNKANSTKSDLNKTVNSQDNVKFRAEALEVQSSLKALNKLFGEQQRMSLINNRLAELTPKTVVLKSFNLADTKKMSLSGTATSYDEIGKYIVSLKNSNLDPAKIAFTNIVLGGATLGEKGSVSFSLEANFTVPLTSNEVAK